MVQYRLTCSKCDMGQTHVTDSVENAKILWNDWSKKYGKNMKCLHEYEFEIFD